MEKQDILEKSRREKTDEGVTYAEKTKAAGMERSAFAC